MKERAYMSLRSKAGRKSISPSFIQKPLQEEISKSIANELLPHSTAREGGYCLKLNAPLTQFRPLYY